MHYKRWGGTYRAGRGPGIATIAGLPNPAPDGVEEPMKSTWLAAFVLAANTCVGAALADQFDLLQGTWTGPWYIGMTSGLARMEIAADGSGKIAFTNLENFGEEPVALAKTSFDGKTFRFAASGTGGAAFSAGMQFAAGGKQMRGNGKYGGFGARLELRRTD